MKIHVCGDLNTPGQFVLIEMQAGYRDKERDPESTTNYIESAKQVSEFV